MVHMGVVDKLLGATFGFLKALCLLGIMLSYISLLDVNGTVLNQNLKEKSRLYAPTSTVGNKLVCTMKTRVAQKRYETELKKAEQMDCKEKK